MPTFIRHGIIAGLTALLLIGIGLKAADLGNVIYSETDASNSAAALFPEGMAPSAVNDNMRGFIGAVVRWFNHSQPTTTSTGSSNQYTVLMAVTPAEYATGMRLAFRANSTNTASASVRINSLAYRSITKGVGTTPLEADDIRAGQHVELTYDQTTGTFQLQSPAGGGTFANAMPSGGSSNAYTIGLSPAPTQYFTGMTFKFRASFSNTGTASIDVSGLGARSITKGAGATALQTDDIRSGQIVELTYDPNTGTFQLGSPMAGGNVPETGSWTPTLAGSTTAGSQTYSVQIGRYLRTNDLVLAWGNIALTATGATTAGDIRVEGLPYSSLNVGNADNYQSCSVIFWAGINLGSGYSQLGLGVQDNASTALLVKSGSRQGAGTIAPTDLESTAGIRFSCSYRIN